MKPRRTIREREVELRALPPIRDLRLESVPRRIARINGRAEAVDTVVSLPRVRFLETPEAARD